MMRRMTMMAVLVAFGLFLMTPALNAAKHPPAACVRYVYLVSADRPVKKEYIRAIEQAGLEMQKWYANQLNGKTFKIHSPAVDVVLSDKPAAWFTTHPNGQNKASWGFYNTLSELKRLRNCSPRQDDYIWVIYSDGPGDSGRAFPGFAYLPEDDLLGLMGKHPKQKNPKRWVAGMGHELGHALGLPHPKDTQKYYNALMWAGFYQPGRAYLTDQDKAILMANTHLNLIDLPQPQPDKQSK